jgi:class 3 adenylate cyclase
MLTDGAEDAQMDVGGWLRKLGLEQYEPAFRENKIDSTILPRLTADDLKDLGVTSVGDRRRLLDAIALLRSEVGPVAEGTAGPGAAVRRGGDGSLGSDAERRQLTVMFCDLVGSTALSARLDPEDMREIIGAYHRCCSENIVRAGGFVAKFMGDGVLAYFGYPQAHEDDAERSVRGALDLAEAVPKLQTSQDAALQVRIGIASGLVVVGDLIGEGVAQEHGVVGETPNLAARLQAVAAPGQVVIAQSTGRLTAGQFDYHNLGRVTLKGMAEPVQAWQVTGATAVQSRFEAQHETSLTPLVGRKEELELLLRRWRQAASGEGHVVLLSGEPGIGKSRLMVALQEWLQPEPHTRLRYFCSPRHRDSTLYPFIAQLEHAAGFLHKDPAEAKLSKIDALLVRAEERAGETAALFAELLGVPARARYPPLPPDPQRRREMTLVALLSQLEGLARQRPVLTIFEDAHWADSTSLELLDRTVERVARLPVLVVITFRPEFAAPWISQSHVTSLSLRHLAERETTSLVGKITAGKALPPEVLNRIVERTDGIPLFVEEMTKSVIESGLLCEEAGGYALTGPLPPLAIPSSLQASLMAR